MCAKMFWGQQSSRFLPIAADGIYSTADGLIQLDRALHSGLLLAEQSRQTMLTSHRSGCGYGYGWEMERWSLPVGETYKVGSHTYSAPGYHSYWLRAEHDQSVVIVLDNYWRGETVATSGTALMSVRYGIPIALA